MKTGKIGNKEKAIIHIAKDQLMMKDEEYRNILESFGVTTSKDLTYLQYERLIENFQAQGFVLKSKKKNSYRKQPKTAWDKEPMLKKISALLITMNLSWNYADGIAKRMFKIDKVSWCTPKQLHSIVAALEYKRRKVAA